MTCDHTAKPLALIPVRGLFLSEGETVPHETDDIVGKSMVTTGAWRILSGHWQPYLKCSKCEKSMSMVDAVKVSFADRVVVRWDDDNHCWRLQGVNKESDMDNKEKCVSGDTPPVSKSILAFFELRPYIEETLRGVIHSSGPIDSDQIPFVIDKIWNAAGGAPIH